MVHHELLPTPSIKAGQGVFTFYGEATIKAPAHVVYEALTDFQSYSKWNEYTPKIETPSGDNTIVVGDMIKLHYRPEPVGNTMAVPCRIISVDKKELSVCWRGCAMKIPSWLLLPEKVQKVTARGENESFYQIWETQAGPLAHAVKWSLGQKLNLMNQGIADGLKKYVEEKQASVGQ